MNTKSMTFPTREATRKAVRAIKAAIEAGVPIYLMHVRGTKTIKVGFQE